MLHSLVRSQVLNLKRLHNIYNQCSRVHIDLFIYSPRCSFSLPHSDSRVLMRRRCPANRTLSASLVSISELQLGSKLSSQEISSSSMVAGLTLVTSISEAGAQIHRHQAEKNIQHFGIQVLIMCRKMEFRQLTGEVVQKLTPEVEVLCALGQEPYKKRERQYRRSCFRPVYLL